MSKQEASGNILSEPDKIRSVKIRPYIFCSISAVLLLLLTSKLTSPLYSNSYGYDCSFYNLMGRAMLSGKVMYRDYFDVKGPLFFFWEAFAQLICPGRHGAFVLQCVCFMVFACYLWKLCILSALSRNKTLAVFGVVYFIYAAIMNFGGNTPEEFYLPFSIACLYHGVRYFEEKQGLKQLALIAGLGLGVAILSKATIAAPSVAVLVVVLADLIKKKNMKRALMMCLVMAGMVFLMIIPFVLYFAHAGALGDMVSGAFFSAFKRGMADKDAQEILKLQTYLFPCVVGLAYCVMRLISRRYNARTFLLLSQCIFSCFVLQFANAAVYYYITALPAVILILLEICGEIKKAYDREEMSVRIRNIMVLMAAVCACLVAFAGDARAMFDDFLKQAVFRAGDKVYEQLTALGEVIPEDERDEVYCLDTGIMFCDINNIFPMNKYPYNVAYLCELYPPAKDEIMKEIKEERPKWLVTEDITYMYIDELLQELLNDYTCYAQSYKAQLWIRKDCLN